MGKHMEIETLYQRYGPMVMRRCRQLLKSENEALDVTQDVFVELLKRRDRLNVQYPSSLLYRIATNLCLNRIRDFRLRTSSKDENLLYGIADACDTDARMEARSTLSRLFGRHLESSRTIAVLHYVDGMTLEETAREVGMSVSGVRNRLRALRSSLEELEER
jgi:RNA polymerase sigma factor (sigma-70 family)